MLPNASTTRKNLILGPLTMLILAVTLFVPFVVRAQVVGATLSGTVMDSSKATVPNATILISNVQTGVARNVVSDGAGFYSAPNLLPGTYDVSVSAPGFSKLVQTGIKLTVGAEQVLNFSLTLGQVTQAVEVTAEAPIVDLASSSISAVIESTTVRELPLNGRDWTQLATLQPGVTSVSSLQADPSAGFSRGNRGYGAELAISGARPQQNSYRLDGININDYANDGPGSVLGGALGVDAIEEFSVLTSNYSAEYGRTSGGVINAITRPGTNQFHGDAYEFLRNSALDARNFFDGATIPPFRRNQFGGSVGGPIQKDRTFFFLDYEGLRQSLGVTHRDTVPSPDARNGILHNPDGSTTTVTVSPLVQPYLPLWPLPKGGLLSTGNTGIFSFAGSDVTAENFVSARIDHTFSKADSIFGSYQFDRAPLSLPDTLGDVLVGSNTGREFVMLEENHVFSPQLTNSIRTGYNRYSADNTRSITAINPVAGDQSLGPIPGQSAAPQLTVPGLTLYTPGINPQARGVFRWNSFQVYDDVFLTRGIHSLKFGFSAERIEDNVAQPPQTNGLFKFGSLANFLTDNPSSFILNLPNSPSPERGIRQTVIGAYAEDDVRWRSNLTLNLGLRYEMATVPTEVHGQLSTLLNLTDPTPHLGDPLFSNPTLRNFEPRIGFAWDPFRNGKTSVRGGFGLFDVLPLPYEIMLLETVASPFAMQGSATNLPPGSFPTGALSLLEAPGHLRDTYIEQHPHRNYVMQWNLSVQRELTPNLALTVAFLGSRGVHQLFHADDMNVVLPTLTPAGYLWPSPAGSGTQVNPNAGRIDGMTWGSNSFYDGLEVTVEKKISHGFQVQGSFTWSKSIDEGSASMAGDPFGNSISSLLFFDQSLKRGLSDYNVGKTLTVSYTWDVPTPKSLHGPAVWAIGGWELGGILQVQTGLPFTPILGGDPLGLNSADPWDFPNRVAGAGCNSAVNPGNVDNYIKLQCFTFPNPSTLLGNAGRNSLIGPGLMNFDFSLFKNNYIRRISESFNAQFRAEFFNVFNRPNFASPIDNSTLFDQSGAPVPGAGLIDGTTTAAREIQFALKIIW